MVIRFFVNHEYNVKAKSCLGCNLEFIGRWYPI